ncbi:MmcQ/YjbR family DNA-binding protein [Segetibacter sp. 3557_3]|uniref:MmcQ/YjbR family DNA-binding protein n=1 Tax=Segetibacter sp. 3557_3 TaxID=2547429 RepID=UPI001058BFCA|nr:MmcQ/YjbR family DNA-binding protein [Segetibacter sp. 3557_3]TDH25187.1 MmcQ/YjbR family DNA-binding protein [Segetibacter sp. 3557_3]
MNIEELRAYCLSFPRVEEGFPFGPGTLVFKVDTRVFALCSLDSNPLSFNVKCDPEVAIGLREQYQSILPGYHMNKRHWNTIVVDGSLPIQLLKEMITNSYNLVARKAQS